MCRKNNSFDPKKLSKRSQSTCKNMLHYQIWFENFKTMGFFYLQVNYFNIHKLNLSWKTKGVLKDSYKTLKGTLKISDY